MLETSYRFLSANCYFKTEVCIIFRHFETAHTSHSSRANLLNVLT